MPYHQSWGMPGIMGRDVIIPQIFFFSRVCVRVISFFFLLFPPTSFCIICFRQTLNRPVLAVLAFFFSFFCARCQLRNRRLERNNYCGYFWKTSTYLIFHLPGEKGKNNHLTKEEKEDPHLLDLSLSPQQQFTLFLHFHTRVCGMWRPLRLKRR